MGFEVMTAQPRGAGFYTAAGVAVYRHRAVRLPGRRAVYVLRPSMITVIYTVPGRHIRYTRTVPVYSYRTGILAIIYDGLNDVIYTRTYGHSKSLLHRRIYTYH